MDTITYEHPCRNLPFALFYRESKVLPGAGSNAALFSPTMHFKAKKMMLPEPHKQRLSVCFFSALQVAVYLFPPKITLTSL